MRALAVVGVNWGDEGKGKIVDLLARENDVIARFQGGSNAGHTVECPQGKFVLHQLPSGVLRAGTTNVLGTGMVIDPVGLFAEIDGLAEKGIAHPNIQVSMRATVCLPIHRLEDELEEDRLGRGAYGSTRRGIAPAYGDRALKKAVQVGELVGNRDRLQKRLAAIVEWKKRVFEGVFGAGDRVSLTELEDWVDSVRERLAPLVTDTDVTFDSAVRESRRIVCEAQLGALRDLIAGIYPYTTSSVCLASYALIGAGLPTGCDLDVLGVMKAFSTCVGAGPFVTEMDGSEAKELRETAIEFGATTGRERRIGHFDAVASRYGARVQRANTIALTKLDCLSGRPSLRICTAYDVRGERTDRFPLVPDLDDAVPVYEDVGGWEEDITGCTEFGQLPDNARRYVERIEELVQCRIGLVSVGPHRDQTIHRDA